MHAYFFQTPANDEMNLIKNESSSLDINCRSTFNSFKSRPFSSTTYYYYYDYVRALFYSLIHQKCLQIL